MASIRARVTSPAGAPQRRRGRRNPAPFRGSIISVAHADPLRYAPTVRHSSREIEPLRRHLPRPTLFVAAILLFLRPSLRPEHHGSGTDMPAYYDGKLFTINFMELSPDAERSAIAHNSAINKIFRSDPGLPGGQPFISVLDAIQGDGFNPLWREFPDRVHHGTTLPRQLTSDNDVAARCAEWGDHAPGHQRGLHLLCRWVQRSRVGRPLATWGLTLGASRCAEVLQGNARRPTRYPPRGAIRALLPNDDGVAGRLDEGHLLWRMLPRRTPLTSPSESGGAFRLCATVGGRWEGGPGALSAGPVRRLSANW